MKELNLTNTEVQELKQMHYQTKDCRIADCFKTVLMRNDGMKWEEIAKLLLLDNSIIRRYIYMYKEGGSEGLLVWDYAGKISLLEFFENLTAYEKIMASWITDNFQKLDP